MGASKDMEITLNPWTKPEDELVRCMREYNEFQQACNLFLWKMNDRLFDLKRSIAAIEEQVRVSPEAAAYAEKMLREELNAAATRLQNLARSLDPNETEPEEPSGFPV